MQFSATGRIINDSSCAAAPVIIYIGIVLR